jgi:hypothetical protein
MNDSERDGSRMTSQASQDVVTGGQNNAYNSVTRDEWQEYIKVSL